MESTFWDEIKGEGDFAKSPWKERIQKVDNHFKLARDSQIQRQLKFGLESSSVIK